ncbi:hypothetical protein PV328_006584 [Microctonus aethiopoides]|uniref:Fanconi anemia group I protein n=1 Tax=Microctonus aethiopoides TaxID=144406 RepID=A0AA39FQ92_9HYME|nr:hypothetical protein PV328_006584 [Microctonus aethiopoides]
MAFYTKYKELLFNKNKEGVKELFENADTTELIELIVPRIKHNHAVKILSDILKSFPATENAQANRRKVVEAVLTAIKNADISNSDANALINRIVEDFPKYSKIQLVRLVDYCLNSIRVNDDNFFSWKDMLPDILQILQEEKYINHRGTEVSGTEYKSQVISSICNQPWEIEILTPLATMFTSIRMEQNDHGTVIRAICSKIDEVKHHELPPLVHQLLRLSDKQDGRLVIGTLQKYFTNIYAQAPNEVNDAMNIDDIGQISLKEIQDTESTVLYHIHQSALLNHSSMKDFMRHLKSITNAPELVLKPFSMSVLLLVSEIYEDQVFDIITQAITRKMQDDEKRNNSAWLQQVLPDNCDLMDVMDQIINNSTKDRHLIIKGLVDLAFVLMESKSKENEENLLHEIGIRIIEKLVRKRHEIGPTVIQSLTNKIVASGTSVSQYVECLSYMCRKSTLIVLDSQGWISTLLEQLLLIPGIAATQVLHATLPLMRVSTTIRDSLVLILRKALYRKGIDIRQMAVTGFLQFLSHLKIGSLNLSQSSSSTSVSGTSGSIYTQATVENNSEHNTRPSSRNNSAFCHEILGILKRCFYHEYQVRQHLYKGLYNSVSSNPELAEYVIDMLLANLKNYYEFDENIKPPLKFHDCSNINGAEAFIEEPIGDLIFALQQIYCNVAAKDTPLIDELSLHLESICRRMAHTELEHLNIDDQIDVMDNMPKSQQKVLSLQLMATTLEALIAFRINSWSIEHQSTVSSINSLFKVYNELCQFSKRVTKSKKGDGKKKKDNNATDTTINKKSRKILKLPSTIIDIKTACKMICLLYEPTVSFATKEQAAILKKRSEFHLYTFRVCISIFQNDKLLHNYERNRHWEKYKANYLKIGELLYRYIVADLDRMRGFDEEVALFGLECFKELCDLVCTTFNAKLPQFLSGIGQSSPTEGLSTQLNAFVSSMQHLIDAYYEEEVDADSVIKKIPLFIFEIISLLMQKTALHNTEMDKIFEWLKKLAKSDKVDAPIAVIILQLITTVEERDAEYGKILDDMSVELCKRFGSIDNSKIGVKEVYNIFSIATMSQAHTIFNNSLKNKINNSAWVLGRLKAEQIFVSTAGISDESDRDQLKVKERSLCRQLSYTIQTLESLANAKICPGPNTDSTFKNLQQLYNVLKLLTKYFISKSTAQNPAFQAVKFIQVVQLAGKPLKTTFYNLITYTEENQSSGRKADAHALRNKVLKETKIIPKVIYEIEQFNKEILTLGKKTGTSLDSYIKHSITRDFRIKQGELAEGLERLDITQMMTQNNTQAEQNRVRNRSLSESETTVTRESDDDTSPPTKKSKREA